MDYSVEQHWESDHEDIWAVAAGLFLEDAPLTTGQGTPMHVTGYPPSEDRLGMELHEPELFNDSHIAIKPAGTTKRVNRRREELLYLREQVKDLEQRLEASKLRCQLVEQQQHETDAEQGKMLRAAWASIAAQQLAQRQQAENEHERLVQLVEEQRRHVKAIQRIVRRMQNQTPPPLPSTSLQAVEDDAMVSSSSVFDDLKRAIMSMYQQQDSVFRDGRFDNVVSAYNECRVVNPYTPQVCVELLDARVVPFNLHATASAVWQSMVRRLASTMTYNDEELQTQENFLQKGFLASLNLPNAKATVQGKVVVQRIDLGARVLVLRATQFSQIGLPQADSVQFSVRHYQWTVIEAPRHERLRGSHHACAQIESFDLSFPTVSENTALTDIEEAGMVDFCKSAVAYHVDLARQSVENILVMNSTFRSTTSATFGGAQRPATIKLETD